MAPFIGSRQLVYLDHAATTFVHPKVMEAMLPFFTEKYFNASSMYSEAQACRRSLDISRESVAKALDCKASEVVFTSGGTESDNTAIKGSAMALKESGNHIITTDIEHHAVLHTCHALEDIGFEVTYLPTNPEGIIDPDLVAKAITPRTTVVSVMLANNEIGAIEPISEIASVVHAGAQNFGTNIVLHTDAVQGANYLDLSVGKLGVDALSLSAHKFNGPKGVGILYLRQGTPFEAQQVGGSHERDRRAGTENVAGAVGAAKALEIAVEGRDAVAEHCLSLRERLIEGISARITGSRLNGHRNMRLPNNVNFSFEKTDSQWTLMALDDAGVAASTGSACRTASLEPSHVLTALGVAADWAIGTLRLTVGWDNTVEEIDRVIDILPGIIESVRATSPDRNGG
ncbi:cysteine desulfurase [Dehalococcoidia bacterium]|nr:cysteine desulfurase [Dehalococcoidia bacterium]